MAIGRVEIMRSIIRSIGLTISGGTLTALNYYKPLVDI